MQNSHLILDVSSLESIPLNHKIGFKQVIIANGDKKTIPQIAKAYIPKASIVEEHQHRDMTEYFYVLEGNCLFLIDNVEYNVKENGFVMIPPQTKHSIITDKVSVRFIYWGCIEST